MIGNAAHVWPIQQMPTEIQSLLQPSLKLPTGSSDRVRVAWGRRSVAKLGEEQ